MKMEKFPTKSYYDHPLLTGRDIMENEASIKT